MADTPPPKLSVLIPDGESFHLRNVIFCLTKIEGIRIYVLTSIGGQTMKYSRYVQKFINHPHTYDSAEWFKLINTVTGEYKIDVIMPIFIHGIRNLIARKGMLKTPEKLFVPASLEQFDTANDKGKLAAHMEQHGIPGPRSFLYQGDNFTEIENMTLSYPLLLKPPLESGGGKGIKLVRTREELQTTLETDAINYPLLIQEHLEGFDSGCNVICYQGKILAHTMQEGNLYDRSKKFAPQVGLTIIDKDEILELVTQLMESLNWTGLANVDLFYDQNARKYQVLEINPRYWNTVYGSCLAGVNFPKIYCEQVMGRKLAAKETQQKEFVNLPGIKVKLFQDPMSILKPAYFWKNSPLPFIFKDPLPFFYQLIWKLRGLWSKR